MNLLLRGIFPSQNFFLLTLCKTEVIIKLNNCVSGIKTESKKHTYEEDKKCNKFVGIHILASCLLLLTKYIPIVSNRDRIIKYMSEKVTF